MPWPIPSAEKNLTLTLPFRLPRAAQRHRVHPPRGLRSVTKLDTKRYKTENSLKTKLDSAVGCNELLAAIGNWNDRILIQFRANLI